MASSQLGCPWHPPVARRSFMPVLLVLAQGLLGTLHVSCGYVGPHHSHSWRHLSRRALVPDGARGSECLRGSAAQSSAAGAPLGERLISPQPIPSTSLPSGAPVNPSHTGKSGPSLPRGPVAALDTNFMELWKPQIPWDEKSINEFGMKLDEEPFQLLDMADHLSELKASDEGLRKQLKKMNKQMMNSWKSLPLAQVHAVAVKGNHPTHQSSLAKLLRKTNFFVERSSEIKRGTGTESVPAEAGSIEKKSGDSRPGDAHTAPLSLEDTLRQAAAERALMNVVHLQNMAMLVEAGSKHGIRVPRAVGDYFSRNAMPDPLGGATANEVASQSPERARREAQKGKGSTGKAKVFSISNAQARTTNQDAGATPSWSSPIEIWDTSSEESESARTPSTKQPRQR